MERCGKVGPEMALFAFEVMGVLRGVVTDDGGRGSFGVAFSMVWKGVRVEVMLQEELSRF